MGLADVEQIIRVGRLGDPDTRDVLMEDINAKVLRIKEILKHKEDLEVEMAPAGVVNFIYGNLGDIQEEIRHDIMAFVSHKAQMVRRLEEMLRIFKDSNMTAIQQEKDLAREGAKKRAFEVILNTKLMGNKIMADVFKKANGSGGDQELASGTIERFSLDAKQFESWLEEKYNDDMFQKNREIKRL